MTLRYNSRHQTYFLISCTSCSRQCCLSWLCGQYMFSFVLCISHSGSIPIKYTYAYFAHLLLLLSTHCTCSIYFFWNFMFSLTENIFNLFLIISLQVSSFGFNYEFQLNNLHSNNVCLYCFHYQLTVCSSYNFVKLIFYLLWFYLWMFQSSVIITVHKHLIKIINTVLNITVLAQERLVLLWYSQHKQDPLWQS